MKSHCYRISIEECDSGEEPLTFSIETHDDLRKIIGRLESKENFSPELATAFASGLKIFAECVRGNADKQPFDELLPLLNNIMKIVKRPAA